MSMTIPIIAETRRWLAIDKPSGLIVERNPFGPSVEDWAYAYLEQHHRNPYLGIVHRIDRVTSGLLLLAKRKSELRRLNEQFRERTVEKVYLARVEQPPAEAAGQLVHWLEKGQAEKLALLREEGYPKAQRCELGYELLARLPDGQALLKVTPTTGRYHQIRAQLSAIGCPIVGDDRYGAQPLEQPSQILLHAWELEFWDEESKQRKRLQAPLPEWGR